MTIYDQCTFCGGMYACDNASKDCLFFLSNWYYLIIESNLMLAFLMISVSDREKECVTKFVCQIYSNNLSYTDCFISNPQLKCHSN